MGTDVSQLDKEGLALEFKNSRFLEGAPASIAKSMAGMANTIGGDILVGVEDDGTLEGYRHNQDDEQKFINIGNDLCNPPIRPTFELVKKKEGDVLVVHIDRFRHLPHGVRIGSKQDDKLAYYTRVGSHTRGAQPHDIAVMFREERYFLQGLIDALKDEILYNHKSNEANCGVANKARNQFLVGDESSAEPALTNYDTNIWDSIMSRGEVNILGDEGLTGKIVVVYRELKSINSLIDRAQHSSAFAVIYCKLERGDQIERTSILSSLGGRINYLQGEFRIILDRLGLKYD